MNQPTLLDEIADEILYTQNKNGISESEFDFLNSLKNYIGERLSKVKNYVSGITQDAPVPKPSMPSVQKSNPQVGATENNLVSNAIKGGNTNENSLTDGVFYQRYPALKNTGLQKSNPAFDKLSAEWRQIRDTIVRPTLSTSRQSTSAAAPYSGTRQVSLQNILSALSRKSYEVYTDPFRLNIVGVRSNNPRPNSFDDTINVFYKDSIGNWQFKSNTATTDPGTDYLNTPINTKGTAILKPGQYKNSHTIGLHRKSYTALVQHRPITVLRDSNRDNILDFNTAKEETGYFGINIHRASLKGSTKVVSKYSAGCQVFSDIHDFDNFMQLCEKHKNLYGNNFTYTLLLEADL